MLCWPRLPSPCLSSLERQSPSPASLLRVWNIVMERPICTGFNINQASHHRVWSIRFPTVTLGSQTGSLAVGQKQISHLQSAVCRLRMLESITVFKVHKNLPQWYSPEHKPPCLGGSAAQSAASLGNWQRMLWVYIRGGSLREEFAVRALDHECLHAPHVRAPWAAQPGPGRSSRDCRGPVSYSSQFCERGAEWKVRDFFSPRLPLSHWGDMEKSSGKES